jgi:hypothetical protein
MRFAGRSPQGGPGIREGNVGEAAPWLPTIISASRKSWACSTGGRPLREMLSNPRRARQGLDLDLVGRQSYVGVAPPDV